MTPEGEVQTAIRKFLEARGWRIKRNQRTSMPGSFSAGEPGEPDLLALYYMPQNRGGSAGLALALWVEVKAPGRKLGPKQIHWHAREKQRGGTVHMADGAESFAVWYRDRYAWLHGRDGVGQIEMELMKA